MIRRHRPGALRRRIGYLGLATLMACSALVAQAGAGADIAHNVKMQPHYPAAAIKNQEPGTVTLVVQVHADSTVGSIVYDPQHSTTTSADLIAAASTAARLALQSANERRQTDRRLRQGTGQVQPDSVARLERSESS